MMEAIKAEKRMSQVCNMHHEAKKNREGGAGVRSQSAEGRGARGEPVEVKLFPQMELTVK